jgi:hypothetical protein
MPKRSSNKKQYINQLASCIVEQTIRKSEKDAGKTPHAVALGRMGGLKGVKARSEKLTPEQRTEIATKAAHKRWDK